MLGILFRNLSLRLLNVSTLRLFRYSFHEVDRMNRCCKADICCSVPLPLRSYIPETTGRITTIFSFGNFTLNVVWRSSTVLDCFIIEDGTAELSQVVGNQTQTFAP
jgi:hypothetical protein